MIYKLTWDEVINACRAALQERGFKVINEIESVEFLEDGGSPASDDQCVSDLIGVSLSFEEDTAEEAPHA